MENVPVLEACRTCANVYVNTSDVNFVHLFRPQESLQAEISLIHIQLESWQVQVLPEDGLPQRICANCFTKFCDVLAFRQECINSQSSLLNAILTNNDTDEHSILCVEDQENKTLRAFFQEDIINMPNIDNGNMLEMNSLNEENTENIVPSNIQIVDPQKNVQLIKDMRPDQTLTVKTIAPNSADSMDLEEMLESSIIPKQIGKTTEQIRKEENEVKEKQCWDIEDDDYSDENEPDGEGCMTRVTNNNLACQYCHCPKTGSLAHLIFCDNDALSQHYLDVHDPNRPYNCPNCPRIFKNRNRREEHVLAEHINKYRIYNGTKNLVTNAVEFLRCNYCYATVPGSMDLHELHCTYKTDWKCNKCNEIFIQTPLSLFRLHERAHNPSKSLSCRYCNRSFVRPGRLAIHEKTHFNIELNKKISCDICTLKFANEMTLKNHKAQVHNVELPLFCFICEKAFSSAAFFQRHQKQFHPKQQDANSCVDCAMPFTSALKLRNHMARPRDENGHCIDPQTEPVQKLARRSFSSCQYCAKRFSTQEQLDKHVATHNPEERPMQCSLCQLRCRNESELQQHINVAHSTHKG